MDTTTDEVQNENEDSRERIMAAALRVFSTKGFIKATNKDVAAAAGIRSPGLIYHYFKDKTDLLRSVVERYAPPLQLVLHPEKLESLPVEEGLDLFAKVYLQLIGDANLGAVMRVVFGEALRDPTFAPIIGQIGPKRIWELLTRYLDRQMDAGALRRVDPSHAALSFVGPFVAYLMLVRVFEAVPFSDTYASQMVANNIDIFLHGLRPEDGAVS
jgi:TetR/AcrR family transcriptional repressor of mexJK operon